MYEIEELDPRIRIMMMEKTDHETRLMAHLVSSTSHTVRTAVHVVTEGMVSLGEGLVTCSEYSIVSDSRFEFRNGFAITRIVNASFLLNASSGQYLILDGPIGPTMY